MGSLGGADVGVRGFQVYSLFGLLFLGLENRGTGSWGRGGEEQAGGVDSTAAA